MKIILAMANLIPEDHIRLDEAFQIFRARKRGANCDEQPPTDDPHLWDWRKTYNEQIEADEAELMQPFTEGVLNALVSSSDGNQKYRILPDEWRRARWPTRVFYSDSIFDFNDGPLGKYDGRSAYIHRATFEKWLVLWLRDWLINEVSYGRLKPDEAEAQALEAGSQPLEVHPDPKSFDPMKEPNWSLTMAVAWIGWRTEEPVRENWSKYCEARWLFFHRTWRNGPEGEVHKGWHLEQKHPSITLLGYSEAYKRSIGSNNPNLSVKAAIAELWQCLSNGKISATGIDESTGSRNVIAAHEWQDLKLAEDRDQDVLKMCTGKFSGTVAYRFLTVSKDDVLREWSEPTPAEVISTSKQEIVTSKSNIDQKTLNKWFRHRIDSWSNDKKPPSEKTDLADAKKVFPDKKIPRKLFRDTRKECVPFTWRRQGQRK